MPLYTGLYNYHDNDEAQQKRAAVADEHIAFVEGLVARDAIVLATVRGDDDSPGGEIVVHAPSKDAAREMFEKDPNTHAELGNWVLTDFRPVAGSLMPAFGDLADS
ncbi:YciI family protein [Mycolicibacterium baixiangningiae]|uniref:YciI family protein n=1 Tax=Mycolicibacterium baixiangningiae TaxID=2761578 RepID=UPI0018D166F2|nr:YciI family protein [Mycolicibacterium baixiangningiae]